MDRPNILFYFSDQQRADTMGCYGQKLNVSPYADRLAEEGVLFEEAYTAQPVCGPCRALFQTGQYPSQIGCWRNGQPLPSGVKTIAEYFEENGYDTAYVGKWHLASRLEDYRKPPLEDFETRAIPPERRGGYRGFWRAADVLEFTSHGYDGCVFDEHMKKREFHGYRADCITDFALEYLDTWKGEKPFFLMVSHIEPHHQNDRGRCEGPEGARERFREFELPGDLAALKGNAEEMYPDYLSCCESVDVNLGRLIGRLKEMGVYENTLLVYTSDHGAHFGTRNRDPHCVGTDDYKRSCHSACLRVPLIIRGPGFTGGKRIRELVSTASLPKTILAAAGVDVGDAMIGEDLRKVADFQTEGRENLVFAQISESRTGRCIHTPDYLYSVYAPDSDGWTEGGSSRYVEDFLYDLKADPMELVNLAQHPDYVRVREELARILVRKMREAGEEAPEILPWE